MFEILRTFPNDPIPEKIVSGEGMYLNTKSGKKYFDMTGGFTAHAVLGWGNKQIIDSIHRQLCKVPHIDYKTFIDENRTKLASKLLEKSIHGLDRLFLCGGSGGEACEAAMHLSYQAHFLNGLTEKQWFISRTQSYHGATTDCMAIGERPNLDFYNPLFPRKRAKVEEHNKFRHLKKGETEKEYGVRCALELEKKILEIGQEKVCAFIGETIMGGLVGDVPPTDNYWLEIRKVCDKYNIHLIVDEVWCGCGVSGKNFCIDWDRVKPDFIFLGKTFAAGYMPISGVVTSSDIENIIKSTSGRVENSTTFQGHSACVAAALACQEIINQEGFLEEVSNKGKKLRDSLNQILKDHDFYKNVRGRGMRNSLEYSCKEQNLFGIAVSDYMKEKFSTLINGKWHRFTFSNSMLISDEELDSFIDQFSYSFKKIARDWDDKFIEQVSNKNFF